MKPASLLAIGSPKDASKTQLVSSAYGPRLHPRTHCLRSCEAALWAIARSAGLLALLLLVNYTFLRIVHPNKVLISGELLIAIVVLCSLVGCVTMLLARAIQRRTARPKPTMPQHMPSVHSVTKRDRLLAESIRTNNVAGIQDAVARGVDLDERWFTGETPLIRAVESGHIEAVEALLRCRAEPSVRNARGHLALHEAAANIKLPPATRIHLVEMLTRAGADPNERDWGRPALHSAMDSVQLVRALLKNGASVDCRSRYQETAAPRAGDNFEDSETALHYALKIGTSEVIVAALLDAGADPLSQNSAGFTPWDYALIAQKNPASSEFHRDTDQVVRRERVKKRRKLATLAVDLMRPIVLAARFDLMMSYASSDGWAGFLRGRLERTGRRIWTPDLLKPRLPCYSAALDGHARNANAAAIFLSDEYLRSEGDDGLAQTLETLKSSFSNNPDKLMVIAPSIWPDSHPSLRGMSPYRVFRFDETNTDDLWRNLASLAQAEPCRIEDMFRDLRESRQAEDRIFMSYRSTSATQVRRIAEHLISCGKNPWFAEYEILLTDLRAFQEAINRGIAESGRVLCFTNHDYARSSYCRIEAHQVLEAFPRPPESVLDVQHPPDGNQLSQRIQALGNRAVAMVDTDLASAHAEICQYLSVEPFKLTEGGERRIYRLTACGRSFVVRASPEWTMTNCNRRIGWRRKVIAAFERTLNDGVSLLAEIAIGPWRMHISDLHRREAMPRLLGDLNKRGEVIYPRGLHLIQIETRENGSCQMTPHPAVTYMDPGGEGYDTRQVPVDQCTWCRRYFVRASPPHMPHETEISFLFALVGVPANDFPLFCRYAHLMDAFVSGLSFDN